MNFLKKVMNKIKLFIKELGNIVTNIAVPIMSMFCAISELFPMPKVTEKLKKAEYYVFFASGTLESIDNIVSDTTDQLENNLDK